jgi:flagellar motility protein MotE (MotC chaperone)
VAEAQDVKVRRLSEMEPTAPKEKGKPAADKTKADGAPSVKKVPKSHPAFYTFAITFLTLFILLSAFILVCRLVVYDDSGSIRYLIDPEGIIRGPVLAFLNPEEASREEYYAMEIDAIYERDLELDERENELDTREEELDERETGLDDKESELDDLIEIYTGWADTIKNAQGSGNPIDTINTVANVLSKADPAKAAAAIAEMTEELAAQILLAMKPAASGAIIGYMEPDIAAALLETMASNEAFDDLDPIP